MVSMDTGVQQLTEALKSKEMYDNTIFIFTGDNGGWFQSSPLFLFTKLLDSLGAAWQPSHGIGSDLIGKIQNNLSVSKNCDMVPHSAVKLIKKFPLILVFYFFVIGHRDPV